MALTDGEKAYIHESAREVAGEIIRDVLQAHIDGCPHGKMLGKAKWIVIGVCVGSAAAGGGDLVARLFSLMGS